MKFRTDPVPVFGFRAGFTEDKPSVTAIDGRSTFVLREELDSAPLDAPERIPAGSMVGFGAELGHARNNVTPTGIGRCWS